MRQYPRSHFEAPAPLAEPPGHAADAAGDVTGDVSAGGGAGGSAGGGAVAPLLRDVVEALPMAVTVYDPDGRLLFANREQHRLFPAISHALTGGTPLKEILRAATASNEYAPLVRADDPPAVRDAFLERTLATFGNQTAREFRSASGVWIRASEHRSAAGNLVCLRADISATRAAEDEAHRLWTFDDVTGLVSRGVLMQRLDALSVNAAAAQPFALVLVDIDFFQSVNDCYGYELGDKLLRVVAGRLKSCFRAADTVARLSGDQMVVLLGGAPTVAALTAAMERMHEQIGLPLALANTEYVPSISAGAVLFPDHGECPKDLLKAAQDALQEAKRNGRGQSRIYDQGMKQSSADRARLADLLRTSIAAREVDIALQPKVCPTSGRVAGFEALARWSVQGRAVSPAVFVPICEETGLSVQLGDIVLDKALAALRRIRQRGFPDATVAVNLATAQLLAHDFVGGVRQKLERFELPCNALEVEVTENVLVQNAMERIDAVIKQFKALGVRVALDDFGTGYASITHLTKLQIDVIKIDRSFVEPLPSQCREMSITRHLLNLARDLGVETVAEGVECEAQLHVLHSLGCDLIQGYLTGRPMNWEQLVQWLDAKRAPALPIGAAA